MAPEELVGRSAPTRALREALDTAAASPANLLLIGETGVGKGLAARRVHGAGPRRGEPFVHVDCTTLAPSLIESELFGHERGAFTDASARRVGRFERADRGTIFLDEVGDLAPGLQGKLLRVLQDREFERVGGAETLPLRARVIAATHRDLSRCVASGTFREDLYYRIDVLQIAVPPLRERTEDLPDLLAAACERLEPGAEPRFSEAAVARLKSHPWPGNVRELWNTVERCLAWVPEGAIGPSAVDRALAPVRERGVPVGGHGDGHRSGSPRVTPRTAAERAAIEAELSATGGNVRRAARRLGVARSTLRYRIQVHRLDHLLLRD